jgi:hypothetical protein
MVDVVTSVAECEQGSGSVGDPPHYAPGTFAAKVAAGGAFLVK